MITTATYPGYTNNLLNNPASDTPSFAKWLVVKTLPTEEGGFGKCSLGSDGITVDLNDIKIVKQPHEFYGRTQVTLELHQDQKDFIEKLYMNVYRQTQTEYPKSAVKSPFFKNTINVRMLTPDKVLGSHMKLRINVYCRMLAGILTFGFYFQTD